MKYLIRGIAGAVLLSVCQFVSAASAAPATPSSHEFTVGASVDGEGSITQIQNSPETPASIVALLAEALPHWSFQPVLRDGKPAVVHTFLRARVQAIPTTGGKFQVRIDYVGVGPMAVPGTSYPHYPAQAVRSHEEGFVLVSYNLRPDGTHAVTDLKHDGGGLNDPLRKAVRDWVSGTKDTPEAVNGQPVPAQLTTYVHFSLGPVESTPVGMAPPASSAPAPPPLSAEEKNLLAAAGYTYQGDLVKTPVSASVLKPAKTETVVLNP